MNIGGTVTYFKTHLTSYFRIKRQTFGVAAYVPTLTKSFCFDSKSYMTAEKMASSVKKKGSTDLAQVCRPFYVHQALWNTTT